MYLYITKYKKNQIDWTYNEKRGHKSPISLDIDIEIQSYDLLFFYPTIAAPVNTEAKAPSITLAGSCS